MPMVWYLPPLSPVVDVIKDVRARRGVPRQPLRGHRRAAHPGRVPRQPLHCRRRRAGRRVLKKLAAMRSYMRDINLAATRATRSPRRSGWRASDMYEMFRLLALAKYDERYVIPTAHAEQAHSLEELATDSPSRTTAEVRRSSARARARRRPRWPWRTSRCSSSARPATPLVAAAGRPPARPGQPPQLGRPGDAGRLFPDRDVGSRRDEVRHEVAPHATPSAPRPRALAATWQVVSLLLDYPDEVLVDRAPLLRDVSRSCRWSARSPAAFLDTLDGDDLGALQARLRRHVRRHPAVLAAPHVLHPRRHPAARRGPRRVQAGIPPGGRRLRHRCRAARPPVRRPRVRRHPRRDDLVEPLTRHRVGIEVLRAGLTAALAIATGARGAALDACPCSTATTRRRCAASSPRVRRRRRSASSRMRSTLA